ncbi:MAG: GNAT family N-acetyltransferase [Roseburia sp.]|nr:GNAT family N-acetyltransferase [Roseburia sp.]
MIRKAVDDNDVRQIDLIIRADILQNPYLYIDSQTYGYWDRDHIATWIAKEGNEIYAILYKYYNTLQVFCINKLTPDKSREIGAYIFRNKFEMISGSAEAMEALFRYAAPFYRKSEGYILTGKNCVNTKQINTDCIDTIEDNVQIATEQDCHEIAKLICSQENIGAHYTTDILEEQLVDRMRNRGCKNIMIKRHNQIVSHMGIYADSREIAVLGGLVTHPDYRGAGYAHTVLGNLAGQVISEGKEPLLFCYEDKLVKWYQKQGWKVITRCAKLVR